VGTVSKGNIDGTFNVNYPLDLEIPFTAGFFKDKLSGTYSGSGIVDNEFSTFSGNFVLDRD